MVRVFKCHSFASQRVIQLEKEPLTICADTDKVFVATSECEIIVFRVTTASCKEIKRFPTISTVERIVFNTFKNYLVTLELKRAWKKITKSVRVYLNWDSSSHDAGRPRTKVRVAGRSHVQHVTTGDQPTSDSTEIVEVPVDGSASCVAVCNYTGNFAVACGQEVKLCSIIEKTVGNSEKTYLDVEIFLELCWNFQVISISLCEEFVVCCSNKEVQGIRVRYEEGEKEATSRPQRKLGSGSVPNIHPLSSPLSPSMASHLSDSIIYLPDQSLDGRNRPSSVPVTEPSSMEPKAEIELTTPSTSARDFSTVCVKPSVRHSPKPGRKSPTFSSSSSNSLMSSASLQETKIIDDEYFVDWNFHHGGSSTSTRNDSVYLPSLHSSTTQSQCHHHGHVISPPVLSDFSGGKVKSCSGLQAETVLHLSDANEREEWTCVILVPTHSGGLPVPIRRMSSNRTDRMRSSSSAHTRTSMCCFVSGSSGGYLYSLCPQVRQISTYKYTDTVTQVGIGQSHLHVVTKSGIETYTSRWGAVSLEMSESSMEANSMDLIHPPSNLDICLCGHEPFLGGFNLSMGTDFLALLSKMEDISEVVEAHWGLYVLHTFSLVETFKDMIDFANTIKSTGPSSYIHLLQEAHLLLSTHPLNLMVQDVQVRESLKEASRLLGDFYSQPDQSNWSLCWPYYHRSEASVKDVVKAGLRLSEKYSPRRFGRGLLDFLDHTLFLKEEYINLSEKTCDAILNIYAVAAPEKLSRVVLLSNMNAYSPETALHHLKTWISVKASSDKKPSVIDKLAFVQLHLKMCEVEVARVELESIGKWELVDVCATHPSLVQEGLTAFTPLAQLMRQHMSGTLLEALVEMVDRNVMSLDSLLTLLKSQTQSSVPYNSHIREVLELIVSNDKRVFLFEEATHMLCEAYLAQLEESSHPSPRQFSVGAHQKFHLPAPEGHFARRFAWLDHLPPFQGPQQMTRPCQLLDLKRIGTGPKSRGTSLSLPIAMAASKAGKREKCACCICNQFLLKLQSLLCSPRLTSYLADFVLKRIGVPQGDYHQDDAKEHLGQGQTPSVRTTGDPRLKAAEDNEVKDSVRLLCLCKLDLEKATELVVERYPSIVGCFASCCFQGSVDRYTHLLRSMETVMKSFSMTPDPAREEVYVKAYKDLLQRISELFPPGQFLDLLPVDGNLYFLFPFLLASFEKEHARALKRKIVEMGKGLLS